MHVDEAELTLHCIAALRHPPALRTATVARARAGRPPQRLLTKATYAPSTAQTAIALTVSSSVWSKTRPKMPVAARARVSGMPRQQARGVLCGRAQQQPSMRAGRGAEWHEAAMAERNASCALNMTLASILDAAGGV